MLIIGASHDPEACDCYPCFSRLMKLWMLMSHWHTLIRWDQT